MLDLEALEEFTIECKKTDDKSTVSGCGPVELSSSTKTVEIRVTPEDPNAEVGVYTLNIVRQASSINTLSQITITDVLDSTNKWEITPDSITNSYGVTVPGDVEKVNISALLSVDPSLTKTNSMS